MVLVPLRPTEIEGQQLGWTRLCSEHFCRSHLPSIELDMFSWSRLSAECKNNRCEFHNPTHLCLNLPSSMHTVCLAMHILNMLWSLNKRLISRVILATTYVARQSHEHGAFSLKNIYADSSTLCTIYESSILYLRARKPWRRCCCLDAGAHSQITLPRENSQPKPFSTNASIITTVLLIGSLAVTNDLFSSYAEWSLLYSLESGQNRTRDSPTRVSAIERES